MTNEAENFTRGTGHIPHPDISHMDYFSDVEVLRAAKLEAIPRYGSIEVMTHRTNVLQHGIRTASEAMIWSNMLLEVGVDHYQVHVLFKADQHDTEEIVTGDTPSPVKWNATPEEKKKMDKEALDAAASVEWMVQKPKSIPSFAQAYSELKEKKALEDRLVNYADKFDGLHEAIHEVICGENPEGFKQVIRDYEPTFRELKDSNTDWTKFIEEFLGEGFFDFPDADSLPVRRPEDLDYTNVDTFIDSLSKGAPKSYKFWLQANHFAFQLDFLGRTFPGWIRMWPEQVVEDIMEVKQGSRFRKTPSGLLVPRNDAQPTFAQSLIDTKTLESISIRGAVLRAVKGYTESSLIFKFAPQE